VLRDTELPGQLAPAGGAAIHVHGPADPLDQVRVGRVRLDTCDGILRRSPVCPVAALDHGLDRGLRRNLRQNLSEVGWFDRLVDYRLNRGRRLDHGINRGLDRRLDHGFGHGLAALL
jgi:hypothetical protein